MTTSEGDWPPERLRTLRLALAELFPRDPDQRRFVADMGWPIRVIRFDASSENSWLSILEYARGRKALDRVLAHALRTDEGRDNPTLLSLHGSTPVPVAQALPLSDRRNPQGDEAHIQRRPIDAQSSSSSVTHVDVGVLTVIQPELAAMRAALGDPRREKGGPDGTIYWHSTVFSSLQERDYSVVLAGIGAAGNPSSASAATRMIARFRPSVMVLVGIAAGMKGKVCIGDVVISERVVGYEGAALVANKDGTQTQQRRPDITRISSAILQDVLNYELDAARLSQAFKRIKGSFPRAPQGRTAEWKHVARTITCHRTTTIASGEKLLRDPSVLHSIRQDIHGKTEVGEMEAAGFVEACQAEKVDWLVVRGISDFGDDLKHDKFHELASKTAAVVTVDFLSHGLDLGGPTSPNQTSVPPPADDTALKDRIAQVASEMSLIVTSAQRILRIIGLSKLSPPPETISNDPRALWHHAISKAVREGGLERLESRIREEVPNSPSVSELLQAIPVTNDNPPQIHQRPRIHKPMPQFPKPKTEQDFEAYCLAFLRAHWKRPNLVLYAKRGEEQYGVDIVDQDHPLDLHAAQCKLHEETKTIPPAEIEGEVAKALTFQPEIQLYAICTTAKKSRNAQDTILAINTEHASANKFRVVIFFWEDIEQFLDRHQELWEELNVTTASSVRMIVREEQHTANAGLLERLFAELKNSPASATEHDRELDRARSLLDKHKYEAAEAILRDLREKAFDRLTPLQRYRCLANLSVVEQVCGRSEESARLLIQACDTYPEHEEALAYRAMALQCLGQEDKAWDCAQEAFRLRPNNAHTAAVFIACAPETMPAEDLLRAIRPESASDPEVLSALADHYLARKQYAEAISIARRAEVDIKYAPYAALTVGRAILEELAPEDPREAHHRLLDQESVMRAAKAFETASLRAEERNHIPLAIQARLYQVDAVRLLEEDETLASVIEEGMRLAHAHKLAKSRFLLARSQLRTRAKDHNRAFNDVNLAADLAPDAIDVALVREACRWNLGDDSSQELVRREILKLLPKAHGVLMPQAVDLAVRASIKRKAWDDASEAVSLAESRGLHVSTALVFRALISHAREDRTTALAQLRQAMAGVDGATPQVEVVFLAENLIRLELFHEAVELLRPLASKTELTHPTQMLLYAAQKSELDDVVLGWCDGLWNAGVRDQQVFNSELGLLQRYAPEKALERIDELLAERPSDRRLQVLRCHVGHILRRAEVMRLVPANAPAPEEVDRNLIEPIVIYLVESGFYLEAIDYAYRCVHLHPDEPSAHFAMFRAMLLVREEKPDLAPPLTVATGCAVEYQVEGESTTHWILIDDSLPRSFPDIRLSTDPIARNLLGHTQGERVVISKAIVDRAVTVKEIKHKYLYRLHDILHQWQLRFPESNLLQQFHTDLGALEETFVNPMLKMLAAMRENIRFADNHYRSGLVSTGVMSKCVGRSVFQVMAHLAAEPDLFVNCAYVDHASFAAALEQLRSCKGIVLDATAVATLRMLELEDVLERMPCKIGYASPLLHLIAAEAKEPSNEEEESVTAMTRDGGKLAFMTQSAGELEIIRLRWARLLDLLRSKGVLIAAAPLASLSPKDREQYADIVGEEAAHAGSAAKDGGFLYWTDDRVNAFLSSHHHKVEPVWSQVVLRWLSQVGVITDLQYRHATARLIAFNYSGTFTDLDILVDAGSVSNWDAGSPVLRRNLAHVGLRDQPNLCLERLVRYCMAVCVEVHLEPNRAALIIQALESVRHRPEVNGIVTALVARLMVRLQMLPLRASELRSTIVTWARARPLA